MPRSLVNFTLDKFNWELKPLKRGCVQGLIIQVYEIYETFPEFVNKFNMM